MKKIQDKKKTMRKKNENFPKSTKYNYCTYREKGFYVKRCIDLIYINFLTITTISCAWGEISLKKKKKPHIPNTPGTVS